MMVMRGIRFSYVMDCCRFLLRLCEWVAMLIIRKTCLRRTTTLLPVHYSSLRTIRARCLVCLWKCEMCLRHKTFFFAGSRARSMLPFFFIIFLPTSLRVWEAKENRPLVLFLLTRAFFRVLVCCSLDLQKGDEKNTEVAHAKFSFLEGKFACLWFSCVTSGCCYLNGHIFMLS